ncbi:sulfur carrier protein ThiS [Wenyingzhuangia sp. IMCC45533]
MTIKVNNQPKEISDKSSVSQLLKQLDQLEHGIAVAVNQQIITKTDWTQKELIDGDDILIIQATQGG